MTNEQTTNPGQVGFAPRLAAAALHLSTTVCLVVTFVIAKLDFVVLGTLLVPFLIWFSFRDEPFVKFHWIQSIWYVLFLMSILPVVAFVVFLWSVQDMVTFQTLDAHLARLEQDAIPYSLGMVMSAVALADESGRTSTTISAWALVIFTLSAIFTSLRYTVMALRGRQKKFTLS